MVEISMTTKLKLKSPQIIIMVIRYAFHCKFHLNQSKLLWTCRFCLCYNLHGFHQSCDCMIFHMTFQQPHSNIFGCKDVIQFGTYYTILVHYHS